MSLIPWRSNKPYNNNNNNNHGRRSYEYSSSNEAPTHLQTWDHHQDHHSHPQILMEAQAQMGFPMGSGEAQIEWKESPEAHVYKARMPGLRPEEVRVEVEEEERVLCITGEKKMAREERKGMWHRIEHSRGRFVQRVTLPLDARVGEVKAYMDNGVLTVTVPKYQHAFYHRDHYNTRPRNINISGH